MPRVLDESDIDLINEEVDLSISEEEERISLPANWSFPEGKAPSLHDGGRMGDVTVHPSVGGVRQAKGRPTTRMAYMWNGTPSELMLAWNSNGTRHDGARHYLRKRFCLCCHRGGFLGNICPDCAHNNCTKCLGGTDQRPQTLPNGEVIKGWVIPCFYLSRDKVPFAVPFYGSISCFLPTCTRVGSQGYLTEADMRYHARSRHRMEYQAYMESQTSNSQGELESLRRRLDALQSQPVVVASTVTNGLDDPEYKTYLAWKKRESKKRETKARKTRDHPIDQNEGVTGG